MRDEFSEKLNREIDEAYRLITEVEEAMLHSSKRLNVSIREVHLLEKVADSDVIFLQNHGVITYGPDIYEAFSRMDAVENTAKTILYSQILGDVREF